MGIIYAVLGSVVTGFLNLIYGKSKNAVFTFTKERSEKQKAARWKRVDWMRREEKYFHFYLSKANSQFLVSIMFMVIGSMMFLIGLAAKFYDRIDLMVIMYVFGGLTYIVSFYFMFEGIAMQQDAMRSIFSDKPPGPPEDNDEAPL